ncbi:hypothetical protein Ade02nite_39020 [Paractinoplanes deccanensis]|uniref:Calcium-binding protein n=1 Tax=Paractinoplanes deccanensis TaxID=113561 RepID=A0ABQ3Y5K2_9ACTN|nr:calcium-binding protein [Actinoplanes deccanensis]GID75261.1 hypothetical protein Ade02nite_39020 [Actinoplanes deccanensis]
MLHSPWPARIALTAAATVTVGALAAPAQAATIGTVAVEQKSIVAYVTSPGVTKHTISITRSGRTVTVDDSVAVKAGKGCSAVGGDKTKVRCTLSVNPTWLRLVLGGGNDILVNRSDLSMNVDAGNGNDRITGGPKRDILDGNIGNDALWGLGGNDDLEAYSGADALSGGDGDDKLDGGWDNDRLLGGNGKDLLNGGFGNDIEDGGPGADRFEQNGDLNGSSDADSIIGGAGLDLLTYAVRSKPVTADADAVRGDDGGAGERDTIGTSIEMIQGGNGNDRLIGTPRTDYLYGDAGNDVITGAAGNDFLYGEAGRDNVNGGAGSDQCERGAGDTVAGCEAS